MEITMIIKKRLEILSKIGSTDMQELVAYLTEQDKLVTDLKYDIDQYREIDQDHLKRIAELEATIRRVKAEVRNIDETFSHPYTTSREGYQNIRSIVECLYKALGEAK